MSLGGEFASDCHGYTCILNSFYGRHHNIVNVECPTKSMGRKQLTVSQAAAKAVKKTKAAQKTKKKETKKVLKNKNLGPGGGDSNPKLSKQKRKKDDDSDTDGGDLEDILAKVS